MSKKISSFTTRISRRLVSCMKDKLKEYLYHCSKLPLWMFELLTSHFITFHLRPMYAKGVFVGHQDIEQIADYSDYAVVLQGPIVTKNDFTLETIRLYKHYFPAITLILSTWEGEGEATVNRLSGEGVTLILQKKPHPTGPMNVNLQLVSSKAGAERAALLGKTFTLKTRTDQRIYNKKALQSLTMILKGFPLEQFAQSKQKGRLVGLSSSARKAFCFSDFFIFGFTNDVNIYFSASLLFNESMLDFERYHGTSSFTPEGYLLTEFLKKVDYPLKYTSEDSLCALATRCVIIDAQLLDWYWHKYQRHLEYRARFHRKENEEIGFLEWCSLYVHFRS